MTELTEFVKDNVVEYNSVEEYLQENQIDLDDWKQWRENGYSEDGFVSVYDKIFTPASVVNPEHLTTITNYQQIINLLLEDINESSFVSDTLAMLNEDAKSEGRDDLVVDTSNALEVMRAYFDYCFSSFGEVSVIKEDDHLILVISED